MSWVLWDSLITSRRYNRLLAHPSGEFAQLLYVLSYTRVDSWGHLPFDPEWFKLNIFPGNQSKTLDDLRVAMILLVSSEMWEKPYRVLDNLYIHIFNFEEKCRDGIRKRRKGKYYAENGEIPTKEMKEDFKDNVAFWNSVRESSSFYINIAEIPEYSGIVRNIAECSGIFRWYSIGIGNSIGIGIGNGNRSNKTETPAGGLLNFPEIIEINGKKIRRTYLQSVLTTIGDDTHQLFRILFRARNATDPYAYIERGLKEGYIYKASVIEDENPTVVTAFIDALTGIPKTSPNRDSKQISHISDIMQTIISNERVV